MSSLNKYTKEVEHTLSQVSINCDKEKAQKLKKYLGTNLHVHGLDSKTQTTICKQGFSFYDHDKEKTFLEYHNIYLESKSHEGKNQAFIFLDKNHKYIPLKTQLKTLPQWVNEVDNWAHSDYLSKFLTRLIEEQTTQKQILSIIKTWNKSKNHWERRQSLVSLYYYARTKKQHLAFDFTKQLIEFLINDKEYYVQKAVGWSLRESYNIYPSETFNFIKEHIKEITSTAFTTCLEKMSDKEKQQLKQLRK